MSALLNHLVTVTLHPTDLSFVSSKDFGPSRLPWLRPEDFAQARVLETRIFAAGSPEAPLVPSADGGRSIAIAEERHDPSRNTSNNPEEGKL